VTPGPDFESIFDRFSKLYWPRKADIEREERQLADRKRDARTEAGLITEFRQALKELPLEELPPPGPGRHTLERSDPDRFLRIVSDVRRPGWTDHAIANGLDPKTVKRIRAQDGVGKNVGKNS
jgi:hypothetical protein